MSCARLRISWRKHARLPPVARSRPYSSGSGSPSSPSPHAHFYSNLVPGMIPVALLGSAVYLGLRLLQANLSHEKYLDEARARVKELEAEVLALQNEKRSKAVAVGESQGSKSSWRLW